MRKGVLFAALVFLVVLIVYWVYWYSKNKCRTGSDCPVLNDGTVKICRSGLFGLKWCSGSSSAKSQMTAGLLGGEGSHGTTATTFGDPQQPGCSTGCGGISPEARGEAQTIAALNGSDPDPESFAGSGRRNWPTAGVFGFGPGTFPYGNYAGYSGSTHREGMSMPQFEWDQAGTFGHTTSGTYPYHSYSGYPGMKEDDSHHW